MGIVKRRAGIQESWMDDIDPQSLDEYFEMRKESMDAAPWSAFNDTINTPENADDLEDIGEVDPNHAHTGQPKVSEGVQHPGGYDSDHDVRTTAQIAAHHKDKGRDDHADRGAAIIAKKKGISHEEAHDEIDSHRKAGKTATGGGGPSFGGDESEELDMYAMEFLNEFLNEEDELRTGKEVYQSLKQARDAKAASLKKQKSYWNDVRNISDPKPSRKDLGDAARRGARWDHGDPMKPTPANFKAAGKSADKFSKEPLFGGGPNPYDTETYSACGAADAEGCAKDDAAQDAVEYKRAYKYTRNTLGMKEDTRGKGVVFETRELQPLEEELEMLNEAYTAKSHNIGDVIGSFQNTLKGGAEDRELGDEENSMLSTFGKHLSHQAGSDAKVSGDQIRTAYKTTIAQHRQTHVSKDPMDYHGRGLVKTGAGDTWQTDDAGNIAKKIVGGRPVKMEPGSEEDKETRKKLKGPAYGGGVSKESSGFEDMLAMTDAVQLTEGSSEFVQRASELILNGFKGDGASLLAALELTYPDAEAHGEALRMAEYMITQLTANI